VYGFWKIGFIYLMNFYHLFFTVLNMQGYLDPEYFLTHKLTDKSDVYSLGVVFLELLTGMHPISHGKNIVREVFSYLRTCFLSLFPSVIGSNCDQQLDVQSMLFVLYICFSKIILLLLYCYILPSYCS